MVGNSDPSLHGNKTSGEWLLIYCCFNFHERRVEMQSRPLNLYENARNLECHRSAATPIMLWSPENCNLFNYSVVTIGMLWLMICIILYLTDAGTVSAVYFRVQQVRLHGHSLAQFISQNSLPPGCPHVRYYLELMSRLECFTWRNKSHAHWHIYHSCGSAWGYSHFLHMVSSAAHLHHSKILSVTGFCVLYALLGGANYQSAGNLKASVPKSMNCAATCNVIRLLLHVFCVDCLCDLAGRVPYCWLSGPGFDSRRHQIFWEVVCLERGRLSRVRAAEELLEWRIAAPV
jgi:hypothetical protein